MCFSGSRGRATKKRDICGLVSKRLNIFLLAEGERKLSILLGNYSKNSSCQLLQPSMLELSFHLDLAACIWLGGKSKVLLYLFLNKD